MSAAVEQIERRAWQRIHESLQKLAIEQASRDHELGCLLLEGLRYSVHLHLGFGSYTEYVERLFGLTPRQVAERLRVAKALEELPRMGEGSRMGTMCWSVERELSRVATDETEEEWIRAAQTHTARQVEQLVAGRGRGDRPSAPVDRRALREVLRFEVSAEVAATWREAVDELRRKTGPAEGLSEEDALLLMARAVLDGPADEGRASYQIAMTVCESCGRGWQQSRGELVAVGDEAVEIASCDAQHIGVVDVSADTHMGAGAGQLTNDTHVGATTGSNARSVSTIPSSASRASQTIAPRVRRAVIRRQHGCCAVPGCSHNQYLDLHHLVPRSEGGTSGKDDLVALSGRYQAQPSLRRTTLTMPAPGATA